MKKAIAVIGIFGIIALSFIFSYIIGFIIIEISGKDAWMFASYKVFALGALAVFGCVGVVYVCIFIGVIILSLYDWIYEKL
jgi:hypothetical protein